MPRQRLPEGPPPAPAVQRLRVQYAKRGRMRFGSVRDVQRALERALRRARIPVAFSAGFHPHPKISYANAIPTCVASEAEYLEISLAQRVDPDDLRTDLDAALPVGIDVLRVVEADSRPLADRLEASRWRVELPGIPVEVAQDAIEQFLARTSVVVTRMLKSGPRDVDARAAVLRADVAASRSASDGSAYAILHLVARHTTPAVRPDDVLNAVRAVAGLDPPVPPLVTRLAQGPLEAATAEVADPLDTSDEAVGSGSGAAPPRDPGSE